MVAGIAEAVGDLRLRAAGPVHTQQLGLAASARLPVELDPLRLGAAPRAHVVGAADESRRHLARRNASRDRVHQAERHLAADRGSELAPRLRAEPLGQQARSVLGIPADRADDGHGVEASQHPLAGAGRFGGLPGRLLQHVEGRERLGRVGLALHQLGHADQNRASIVVHGLISCTAPQGARV